VLLIGLAPSSLAKPFHQPAGVDLRSRCGFCRPGFPGPGGIWGVPAPNRPLVGMGWVGNHALEPGLLVVLPIARPGYVLSLAALCCAALIGIGLLEEAGFDDLSVQGCIMNSSIRERCVLHYPVLSIVVFMMRSCGWLAWFLFCTTLCSPRPANTRRNKTDGRPLKGLAWRP
jgi:hypothetical protein